MDKHVVMDNIYDLMFNNKKQDDWFIQSFQDGWINKRERIVLIDEPNGIEYEITIKENN